ncbi:hypothetical protein [Novipirellula rosea]|uniref:DUF3347 domain-containing protein n=1 Tax=Novipirellula rosea TaxID=1031540 RepID=A0ABP8NR46_9BACT
MSKWFVKIAVNEFLPLALLALMLAGCQTDENVAGLNESPPSTTAANASAAENTSDVDALVKSYLDLRKTLAEDKSDGIAVKVAAIGEKAKPLFNSDNADVERVAKAIATSAEPKPEDLVAARKAYQSISASMIELVKIASPSNQAVSELYVAYCPMVKASWLQTTEEIENPYMGQKMLSCGEIKEEIPTE